MTTGDYNAGRALLLGLQHEHCRLFYGATRADNTGDTGDTPQNLGISLGCPLYPHVYPLRIKQPVQPDVADIPFYHQDNNRVSAGGGYSVLGHQQRYGGKQLFSDHIQGQYSR